MSSLQERIAAVRQAREQERQFVLDVPGYESVGLCARYKVLGYEQLRDIGIRNQGSSGPESELATFADTLARANVELLVRERDGAYRALGRWTSSTVREQLGIDLPDGVGQREAILAVFNGPTGGTDLALHFGEYEARAMAAGQEVDETVLGESEARSDVEELSISQ